MKKTSQFFTRRRLYQAWGGMFVLCAGLGFVVEPPSLVRAVFFLLSLVFFLPPAVLLYRAHRTGDNRDRKLIRGLSAAWLILTLTLLLLNIRSALMGRFWGDFFHAMLTVISSPMLVSGYWIVPIFLWACLLAASFIRK